MWHNSIEVPETFAGCPSIIFSAKYSSRCTYLECGSFVLRVCWSASAGQQNRFANRRAISLPYKSTIPFSPAFPSNLPPDCCTHLSCLSSLHLPRMSLILRRKIASTMTQRSPISLLSSTRCPVALVRSSASCSSTSSRSIRTSIGITE